MIVTVGKKQIDTDKPLIPGYSGITCKDYCEFRLDCEAKGLDEAELNRAHIGLFYGLTQQELYSVPATAYLLMSKIVNNYVSVVNDTVKTYHTHKGVFYYLYLDVDNMKVGHFADLEHIESQYPNIWQRLANVVSILLYTEEQLDENDTLNYNGSVAMSRVELVNEFPFSVILAFHNAYVQKKRTLQTITQRYSVIVAQLETLKGLMIEKQLELTLT